MTFADRSVASFLDDVASERVAPSAGAVVAFEGAMAAALAEMVCHHTDDDLTTDDLRAARGGLAAGRRRLLDLADEDGAAVDEVHRSFEFDTDAEAGQAALERVTEVPLLIGEACAAVSRDAATAAENGTPTARIDAVVAAGLARAATRSAARIVRANCAMVDDDDFVASARERATEAEATAEAGVEAATAALDG